MRIDPAGATENLLVPAANLSNVWVKLPEGCEYRINKKGMVIVVR